MDFTLDTEQAALRDAVREMTGRMKVGDEVGPPTLDPEQWSALAGLGVLAEESLGPVEEMIVAEGLGRARVRLPYAETVFATAVLAEAGGHDDLLGAIGDGSAVVVPALYEPSRTWRSAPETTETDGALTGVKDPVPYAAAATHALVRTQGTLHLVADPPVVGSGFAFDATSADVVSGDRTVLDAAVNRATVVLCAEALGAMSAALDLTVEYLKTRKQFGVALMSFQTLTQRAADMYTALELARSSVQYAAMTLADGDLAEQAAAAPLVSRVKVVTGRSGRLIGQEAIQLHGGIGMTAEYAVGHYTARLTDLEHTFGDTRMHLRALANGVGGYRTVDVI